VFIETCVNTTCAPVERNVSGNGTKSISLRWSEDEYFATRFINIPFLRDGDLEPTSRILTTFLSSIHRVNSPGRTPASRTA
jgi:hypothetical protein